MKCSQCQNLIHGKRYWKTFCRDCAIKTAVLAQQHEGQVLAAIPFDLPKRSSSISSVA